MICNIGELIMVYLRTFPGRHTSQIASHKYGLFKVLQKLTIHTWLTRAVIGICRLLFNISDLTKYHETREHGPGKGRIGPKWAA